MAEDNNNDFLDLIESYKRFSKFIIMLFDESKLDSKNQILRNFIAKAHSLINSISILLNAEQEGEAMALYRLLVERYFYLEYLHKTESYQAFKDWSYIKTFESRNKMRSNSEFYNSIDKELLTDSKKQVNKYQNLKKKENKWVEPRIENFAKQIDLSLLYNFGYDIGSSHIHPRADEGYWDAIRIVKKEKIIDSRKNNILHSSMLLSIGILMNASNRSDFSFNKYLNYYCNTIFEYLDKNKELPNLKGIENLFILNTISELEGKNN